MTATTEDTTRYDIGAGILDKIFGPAWREKAPKTGIQAADDLARIAVEHTYTDAWARDALDFKTRSVICLSILTTIGHTTEEIKLHIEAALANGWTHEDLFEIFLHMIPYIGVPKTVAALRVAGETFMELWAREAAEAETAAAAENAN